MAKNVREKERVERKKTDALAWAKEAKVDGDATCVALPDGVTWWKPKAGLNRVDVIPFVAGRGNPRADVGYVHFEREYFQHRVTGFDGRGKPYVCLQCFKKRCPVCERARCPLPTDSEELTKSLWGRQKHLWCVIDLDSKERKIQVYESGHKNKGSGFFELLETRFLINKKWASFADLERGYTMGLTGVDDSFSGVKYVKVSAIDFIDRDKQYDEEEMLKQSVCLDECLVELSYGKLKGILNGEGDGEDVPADEPDAHEGHTGNGRAEEPRKPDPEPDVVVHTEIEKGSTVTHPEFGKCDVVDVRGDKVKLMDSRNKPHVASAKDCEPYEEKPPEDEWEKQSDSADEWPDDPEPPKRGRK